ncbi:MAG: hypothetical protein LQ352_007779, partial [Teloschistes flavicans]
MPTKIREKDKDRSDITRPKEKSRHRSSRSVRKSSYTKDPDRSPTRPERSATITTPPSTRKTSLPKPELERRSSSNPATPQGSKMSLPYPTFSKAHSKEAIGSREDIANARLSYYTPDPTDLDRRKEKQTEQDTPVNPPAAPPSPPLTTDPLPPAEVKREKSPHTAKTTPRKTDRKKTDLQKAADELKRKLGRGGSIVSEREGRVRTPSSRSRRADRELAQDEDKSAQPDQTSKPGTPSRTRAKVVTVEDAASTSSLRASASPPSSNLKHEDASTESITDSDATSIAPNQPTTQQPTPHIEPVSNLSDETPKTPSRAEPHYVLSRQETPAYDVKLKASLSFRPSVEESPMPPPPPPPPTVPFQMPKVDYLMQNGGLPQAVPKSLLGAGQAPPSTGQPVPALSVQVERFFGPFHGLLDNYTKVMSKSGSLAVATGYRSVARRLLDRLEAVFARNISSETCICTMCQASPLPAVEDERGLSWGEILEYVCGRQDLPQWPPFVLDSSQMGLGISGNMKQTPMQNLDVDVPEEYRDHYVRQSKKTKLAVDQWLETQPTNPTSPPQDIDDETLTFAMLTRLDPEQRPTFSSLIGVGPDRPPSRAGTPFVAPRSELLTQTGLAVQRLYRLATPPRDPESAIFLLTNPLLHNVLATLAAISDAEWEILISGRFDGFLRSGAEDFPPTSANDSNANIPTHNVFSSPSRGPTTTPGILPPSRGPTPFARSQTPATAGAPVAIDEETEIATLAEIEREIYTSMEALEDAFEALHGKAETVRNALRQRGAGLALANQMRRGGALGLDQHNLDARLGTPASA